MSFDLKKKKNGEADWTEKLGDQNEDWSWYFFKSKILKLLVGTDQLTEIQRSAPDLTDWVSSQWRH